MNEAMLAAKRELGVRAVLTLPTGSVMELDGSDVVAFAVEEGADGALLPGNVLSARLTLELENEAGQWRGVPLVGATAQLSVRCGNEELPCGAYIIDSVSAMERGGTIRLGGSDSIASELAAEFSDGLEYPATLGQVWQHWLSQTRYAWSGELPGGDMVIPAVPEWGSVSLRRAAGWIAQAAGCFVRADRLGGLELVPCTGGEPDGLGPEAYWNLDDGFQSWGPIAAVQVKNGETEFTVRDGEGETVSAQGNPLLQTEAAASGMLARLKGLRLEKVGFEWRGDPGVGVGSRIALTDTYGDRKICTVTRQTMKFDKGFSAQAVCSVPDSGDGGIVRAITPEGGVNAGALVGTVDGGLLAAESVTARSIAAKSITAEKLAAGSVTADKLDAETVSARVAKFVAAEMEKLTAAEIEADELYAAFGHFMNLSAESLAAGRAEIDVLASALAEFVSLHAGTGEFDFAVVQNLVAQAMSLAQGAMDTVYINNLAVTSANLLSATLGKLVIKGDDGKYYRVFVGSDGRISTEIVEDVTAEAEGGRQIVETSMNVGNLNATTIQGSGAVINSILTTALSAEKITAADAMIASATIPALYTTTIEALGGSLDLSANRSIQLIVGGAVDEATGEIDLAISSITQRADALEVSLEQKVDGEEMRSYIRYEDGVVEIGKSDSRYTTRTSDSGFVVLQDGAEMTSMVKNTVSAPVMEARRQFQIGKFVIRTGNDGGLLFM